MTDDLVILIPVFRRPKNVVPVLTSAWEETAPRRVLFVVTEGDHTEVDAIERVGGEYMIVPDEGRRGEYARKINAGYRATTERFIFTGADDLRFHPGWFEAAMAKMSPTTGVVGTNDLGNPAVLRGDHSTHSLVRREYADFGTVDERGKIYHEGYPHEFVDDEMVGTARARHAFVPALDSVVEHLHPSWGKAESDPLYAAHYHRLIEGRKLFNARRPLWQRRLQPWTGVRNG